MDTPKMLGQTNSFSEFDYTFFGFHYDLAKSSDPMTRVASETAFEAVIDAGKESHLVDICTPPHIQEGRYFENLLLVFLFLTG